MLLLQLLLRGQPHISAVRTLAQCVRLTEEALGVRFKHPGPNSEQLQKKKQ